MLSNFDISIVKLRNGEHFYEFHLDTAFFESFGNNELQEADFNVSVKVNKNERIIMAHFDIKGIAGLICDRSLESYQEEMSIVDSVAYKFGDTEEVLSENLIQITDNTHEINVGQLLFEMVSFAVPMKKLHPKFRGEHEGNDADFVYSTSTAGEKEEDEQDNETPWDSLLQLKDKFKKPE
jgi:uncharacterized metal-binding protein YceD (DUF177 family)